MDKMLAIAVSGDNNIFSETSDKIHGATTYMKSGFEMKKVVDFSLTLDLSKEEDRYDVHGDPYRGYKLSLYENGNLKIETYFNVKQWKKVSEICKSTDANTFYLGMRRSNIEYGYCNAYGKMILRNCRFYTRPLSSEEIRLNYDTRLAYDRDNIN